MLERNRYIAIIKGNAKQGKKLPIILKGTLNTSPPLLCTTLSFDTICWGNKHLGEPDTT